MRRTYRSYLQLSFFVASLSTLGFAQHYVAKPPICSTEKVNHTDCTFIINRLYPVTLPTIQMRHGAKIIVSLENSLAFETVTLDQTSATLLPGTDQGAALVAAAIPNIKGLTFSSLVIPGAQPVAAADTAHTLQRGAPDSAEAQVIDELTHLQELLTEGSQPIDDLFGHITIVYAQLSQILSPLPRPVAGPLAPPPPLVDPNTPDPWKMGQFPTWRGYLLCELVGGYDCTTDPNPPVNKPSFNNVLREIGQLEAVLPATPAPANLLFDQHGFDVLAQQTSKHIANLPSATQQPYLDALNLYVTQENRIVSVMATLGTSLPVVQKDFQTYYQNIQLCMTATTQDELGAITDPSNTTTSYPRFLGRQLVFSVNVVNRIATSLASVTSSSAKTAITTITVIYADPRFETSAGVLFNFVHDRTFANQTITTPAPGSSQVAGEIQIYETKTRPAVVPFVAAHWRLGNDFIVPIDHRRGAIYATAWVGFNPDNTLPEYGIGPTLSWRSFMLSALYDRTHDTRLTPGVSVGQILCSPNPPAGSSLPLCTPAPPAPTTQTFATNSFAFGISIRIPTTFAAGTGGVSR